MATAPLDRFVERMPKAELHLHLEGSIRPATLLRLAARHRVDLPAATVAGVREWFRFEGFAEFVDIYLACCRCLRDPEDFQLAAAELMAEQERQNIAYCEAHFTVGTHAANGANLGELADALGETLATEGRRRGVTLRLIPDIVRNVPERADLTLEWALAGRSRGVVALGLSGFESEPSAPFREHFAEAARQGLNRVAHAGEHGGPQVIRDTLADCRPQRIGHGICAVDDPELLAELHRRVLPLEISPSSNVALGAVASIAEHPFDRLLAAGVEVTVNTDDPAFFDVTLAEEYRRLQHAFGYPAERLAGLSLAALRHAFLAADERRTLEAEFRRQFAELGEELLGAPVVPATDPAG